ncbi:MAG: hypothetical protein QME76_08180, partial [Bacillota bacterium]|nr:hypothetical protein [Bacillota bacterium]
KLSIKALRKRHCSVFKDRFDGPLSLTATFVIVSLAAPRCQRAISWFPRKNSLPGSRRKS